MVFLIILVLGSKKREKANDISDNFRFGEQKREKANDNSDDFGFGEQKT